MKRNGIRNGQIFSLLSVGLTAALAPAAFAQGERSNRIDPHPVRQQVGIVSRVIMRNAWVAFGHPVKLGSKIEISAFADGGDTLFAGTVNWSSAIAPYEAYVTGIHAVTTKHDINEFKDYTILGYVTKKQVDYGTQPETIGDAIFPAAGLYVRADIDDTQIPPDANVEPVRVNIAALRAQKTRIATVIADAAEKALGLDPLIPAEAQIPEYAVNFSALAENMRVFRRLSIPDPVTEKLLARLMALAANSGQVSASVPSNFFRPPSANTSGDASSSSAGTPRP